MILLSESPFRSLASTRPGRAALLSGAVLYVGAVGASVALGSWLVLLPAVLVVSLTAVYVLGASPIVAGVLLITPLLSSSFRVPLAGLQIWEPLLGILLGAVLWAVTTRQARLATVRLKASDLLVALFLFWLSLSYATALTDQRDPTAFVQSFLPPSIVYVAGRLAFSSAQRARWMLLVGAIGVLAAAELWLEFFLRTPMFADPATYEWLTPTSFRAGSMLQGPNFAAAYIALSLAAVAPYLRRPGLPGIGARVAALVLLSTFGATQSISGLIAMAVVLAGLVFAAGKVAHRVLIVALAVVVLNPLTRNEIAQQPWYASHNVSIGTRFDLYQAASAALQFAARDPVLSVVGLGYGQWQVLGSRFTVSQAASRQGQPLENAFLTLLLENGLPALALFVALLSVSIWNGWKNRADPVRLGGALATLAFTVSCGSGTTIDFPQVSGLALFLLAAANSASAPASTPDDITEARGRSTRPRAGPSHRLA